MIIALTIAALNWLDILACDIQHTYLLAELRENSYTTAGLEFGSYLGKIMIVKMDFYGSKSSVETFRSMLSEKVWWVRFRPTGADPYVWI